VRLSTRGAVHRTCTCSSRTARTSSSDSRRREPLGHVLGRGGLISKKLSEKEPRDESCGSKPRSTALRAHVGRRTMSSRERKGGEGQEVVCFVTCRDHAYYCTCTCTSYYKPNTCTRTYLARPVCKSDTSTCTRTVETFQTKYSHTETKSRRALLVAQIS